MAQNEPKNVESFIDEERLTALTLAVKFWGMVSQSPKATPSTEGTVLKTADRFYEWLTR
jgi:hypothetical protein